MQCPLCGRDVPDLAGGICDACASERKPLLTCPDVVDVTRCAHCGRLLKGGTWASAPAEVDPLVRDAVRAEIDLDPELSHIELEQDLHWQDERNAMAHLRLRASFRGHAVERSASFKVRLKRSACPDCSREFGGYFEAILQVRGSDERVLRAETDRVLRFLHEHIDRHRDAQKTGAWISKSEPVRGGGVDLYLGSLDVARQAAHALADRYGAEYAESGKLVGRRDGRDLVRFTLLVRLPAYLPGDFIQADGRVYKVLRRERRRLTLWDLDRREQVTREPRRLHDVRVIGRASDESEAVVVSFHPGRLQVLDPATLRTVDLDAQEDYRGQETVHVFRHEDRLYVLPKP